MKISTINGLVGTKLAERTMTGTSRRRRSGEELTDLILTIFQANAELINAGPLVARDPTMISMRWQMLSALKSEGKTAARLGREIGITRQGALLNVQLLQDLGYVTLTDNSEDQRAKKAALTPAGAAKLNEVNHYSATWLTQLSSHFEEAQIRAAVEVVGKLRSLVLASVNSLQG